MAKRNSEILEAGEISFYIRHKVVSPGENPKIKDPNGIQRLYILLHVKNERLYRLLIVGKKELPSTKEHEKHLILIELVTKDMAEVTKRLEAEVYTTVTRGKRIQPEAILVAAGDYSINFDGNRTFLNYKLKHTLTLTRLRTVLNIAEHGRYVLSVKSPMLLNRQDSSGTLPAYPRKLQTLFRGLHFVPANPIELINYINAQVILMGISS